MGVIFPKLELASSSVGRCRLSLERCRTNAGRLFGKLGGGFVQTWAAFGQFGSLTIMRRWISTELGGCFRAIGANVGLMWPTAFGLVWVNTGLVQASMRLASSILDVCCHRQSIQERLLHPTSPLKVRGPLSCVQSVFASHRQSKNNKHANADVVCLRAQQTIASTCFCAGLAAVPRTSRASIGARRRTRLCSMC